MPLSRLYCHCLISLLFLFFLYLPLVSQAQSYVLEVDIADTAVIGSHYDVRIPVFMKNTEDSIGAFDFRLTVNLPGSVVLKDTIITDGCLTESWEVTNSQWADPEHNALRVWGIANWIDIPAKAPALYYPQYGETPLFYLMADIVAESDSSKVRATIDFKYEQPTEFIVSDEVGFTVGTHLVEFIDTVYYGCAEWYAGECISWIELPGPPADSTEYWPYHQAWLDSSISRLTPGRIDVGYHLCGDVMGEDNKVNLADITAMIAYVYLDGPPPVYDWSADIDGSRDGKINLADITRLVDFVYISHRMLDCY